MKTPSILESFRVFYVPRGNIFSRMKKYVCFNTYVKVTQAPWDVE